LEFVRPVKRITPDYVFKLLLNRFGLTLFF
jgi:hypothetical protein